MTPETLVVLEGLTIGFAVVCGIVAILSFISLCEDNNDLTNKAVKTMLFLLLVGLFGAGISGGLAWGLSKARTDACADLVETKANHD